MYQLESIIYGYRRCPREKSIIFSLLFCTFHFRIFLSWVHSVLILDKSLQWTDPDESINNCPRNDLECREHLTHRLYKSGFFFAYVIKESLRERTRVLVRQTRHTRVSKEIKGKVVSVVRITMVHLLPHSPIFVSKTTVWQT